MSKRWLTTVAFAGALALTGAACSSNKTADTTPAAGGSSSTPAAATADYTAAYASIRESYNHMFGTGDALSGAIATQKKLGAIKSPAVNLRLALGQGLGEHALLAAFAMQKGFDGSPDFDAAAKALDANSVGLGDAIGSLYGNDAKDAFLKQWRDHIRMFVDFTVATAQGDDAKRKAALDELGQYKDSFGKFLSTATGIPASAASGALQEHVNQLVAALDTYKSKDFKKTYSEVRHAYAHMYVTGDALAGSIAKQKKLGPINTKAGDLRLAVDRLLGEHAGLAVFAMQKGIDGKPDFEAIAGALDGNSADLGAAIGSLYGDAAKDSFLKQWRDHIRMFVDFTVGTAKKDDAARTKALEELSQYKTSFAQFLATATGLPAEAGAGALQMHVDQLTAALDKYIGR